MVIRIPDSAFAYAAPAPASPLPAMQRRAKSMRGLQGAIENLSLAMTAEAGGAEADKALAKARSALLAGAGSPELEPDFAQALDEAKRLQEQGQATLARESAIGSLVSAIKQTSALPLSFAQKAAFGRALVGRAVREGLLDPTQQRTWEEAASSSGLYQDTRRRLAATSAPGEALALVQEAKAAGELVEHDAVSLDALAAERQPVETRRHQARLAWKEQDDLAAYARGELPEAMSEDSFRLVHGARGAQGAYARYQAARSEAEALALIRGKDDEAIEAAQAAWKGEPAVFASALAKDAAQRRRDPVGYVLAAVPGLAQALEETPEAERSALLWSMQEGLGFAEGERSPWTADQERALADAWDALPAGHGGRNEKLGFFEKHLLRLPRKQRGTAIRRVVQQGIADGTEAELTRLVAELDGGRINPARSLVGKLTPAGEQWAAKGHLDSGAGMTSQPQVEDPMVDDSRSDEEHSPQVVLPSDLLQSGNEKEPTPILDSEPDPLAAARERVSTIDAVARISRPEELTTILPRIKDAFADDPQAAARLEAKARELATNPPLPASRDTEGRVRNFNEWAGDLGYYRDRHLIDAADAVRNADYEVRIEEDGSLSVIASGDEDAFTVLSAEEIANLNLSRPEDLARFKLLLDAVSGSATLEELLVVAEELDPTVITTGFNPRRGRYKSVRASETVELIRSASEALANDADPAAVAAALKAGLFPTSDWLVLGELLFSLTPFGLALDAADAARAIETLQESDDETEREGAWGDLIVAVIGVAPVGDALKLGARNIGTAKTWLRRLADQDNWTTEQLIVRAEHFAQIGLRKKRVSFQIERLVGEAWTNLGKAARKTVRGKAAQLYGGLAEKLVRPAAQARLKLDGYRVFDGETNLDYQGVSFRIDVVGLREGAEPVGRHGKDTIEVAGLRYLLKDVRLIDAKFASAGSSDAQRAALKRLDGRGAVRRYVPLLEDMPVEDLAEILNQIEEFRAAGITITIDMIARHAETFEKGTTIAEFAGPLIAAGLASAMSLDEREQAPQLEAKPREGSK